jgi:molecular chaperone DnaK
MNEDGQVITPEGQNYTPEEVSAEIIRKLLREAEAELGRPIRKAIITCPAWFTDQQRRATVSAGELAGLQVLEIVNEPIAAAICYGLDKLEEGQVVVVYRLGGGTFDCSVIEYRGGELKHLASDGNCNLGGDDWTITLMKRVAEKVEERFGENPLFDPPAKRQLYENCEDAKRVFNGVDRWRIACALRDQTTEVDVTREEFEQWTELHLAATLDHTEQAIQKAKRSWSEVNHLLLVGGATRLRRVAEALERLTGKQPIKTGMEDTMVALGAAALTAKEVKVGHGRRAKLRPVRVLETTPHALGVLVNAPPGSELPLINRVIIDEGTGIPVERSREDFKTDNPEFFDVPVLQGSNPDPKRCTILCTYRFKCLPGTAPGSPIKITFAYNASNQIVVQAVDGKRGETLIGEQVMHMAQALPSPQQMLQTNTLLHEHGELNKRSHFDENVQFSVFCPKAVPPEVWCDLLASAHLEEKRLGTPPDAPKPLEVARVKAQAMLNLSPEEIRESTQDSSQAVPQGGQITFLPQIDGVEFNPPQQSFLWKEDEHTVGFRMRASSELDGQVARGRMTVFLGAIIVAEIVLKIEVDRSAAERQGLKPTREPISARPYRKVFASYSHRDLVIVEQFERYAEAFGDEYLRDWKVLRSGDRWNEKLLGLIDQADVFQLFWSWNAMRSEYVRREWEHALKRGQGGFIRPVYWEDPFPSLPDLPPRDLARLHFQKIGWDFCRRVPAVGATVEAKPTSTSSTAGPPSMPLKAPQDTKMADKLPPASPATAHPHDRRRRVVSRLAAIRQVMAKPPLWPAVRPCRVHGRKSGLCCQPHAAACERQPPDRDPAGAAPSRPRSPRS